MNFPKNQSFRARKIVSMRKNTGANFERMLREGELIVPPLDIRVMPQDGRGRPDAILDVAWRGRSCRYVVELKKDAKPQTLRLAIDQAKRYAETLGQGQPMVVAPYLSEEKLEQLQNEGVSALDFCGNAAVDAPGEFLFWKTGNPNRFPDRSGSRSAYRGASSLVARTLLLDPEFPTVGAVLDAVKQRGGSLTMGTVSKALKRLQEDLIIERPGGRGVRLIQPQRLLEQLLDAYKPPMVESTWLGKVRLGETDLWRRLEEIARGGGLIRTGEASADQYAVYAGEPIIACYCRETPSKVIEQLDSDAEETRSFPNLRLIQTDDQRVYFDRRPGFAASPIQSWLEMASGDKRQKQVAEQIEVVLLGRSGLEP